MNVIEIFFILGTIALFYAAAVWIDHTVHAKRKLTYRMNKSRVTKL